MDLTCSKTSELSPHSFLKDAETRLLVGCGESVYNCSVVIGERNQHYCGREKEAVRGSTCTSPVPHILTYGRILYFWSHVISLLVVRPQTFESIAELTVELERTLAPKTPTHIEMKRDIRGTQSFLACPRQSIMDPQIKRYALD